jgi:hypothetical protein
VLNCPLPLVLISLVFVPLHATASTKTKMIVSETTLSLQPSWPLFVSVLGSFSYFTRSEVSIRESIHCVNCGDCEDAASDRSI